MYKAFKFRLYPNKEQKQIINKNFGCNWNLSLWRSLDTESVKEKILTVK